MIILGIAQDEQAVFLGKTFMATLDFGKHRFPKHFTQKVAVPDADLFNKLSKDAHVGDEIEVTTVTEWPAVNTYLESYSRVI